MAAIEFATLAGPVSDEEPCGPDLDLAGDPDYMNFIARTEGLLPATYFSGPEGKPFDRTTIDFAAEFTTAAPLLERTRDVRLLALLAKLFILNRDLTSFAACVGLTDTLLSERWDDVHPQGMDGDFGIRMAALESLDDMPPVVFPMQYMPLVNHRRLGPITYRSWMIATGEAKPREGEAIVEPAAIEAAMMEAELPALLETRSQFQGLQSALGNLRDICVDRAGADRAAKLERLPDLVGKILKFLEGVVIRRDPSLAAPQADGAGTAADGSAASAAPSAIPAGAVASTRDVADALAAIADYFGRCEPSSPALLLVRQAEQLMGKSFLEVMRVLVPNHMEQAAVQIGKDKQIFDLPIERLSAFAEGLPVPEQEAAEATDAAPPRRLEAKTRNDAIRLLDQIGTYYRIAEPSSPVPFLTDRARSFAERDFLSLLKELLPEGAFKATPGS
ncbi:MAG: type secretion system protein ImpA [Hyphomicrobiales bacterium]